MKIFIPKALTVFISASIVVPFIPVYADDDAAVSDEKYAAIMMPYIDYYNYENYEADIARIYDNHIVRLYSQDNEAKEYELAPSVDYWASNASSNEILTGDERKQIIDDILGANFLTDSYRNPVNLCKFRTNSEGQITQLYLPVHSREGFDEKALDINAQNAYGIASFGGMLSGSVLCDGITGFRAPYNTKYWNDETKFSSFPVNSADYISADPTGRSFVFGEYDEDGIAPQLLLEYIRYGDWSINDYGTADNNQTVLVTSISPVSDGTYEITGRCAGQNLSFYTDPEAVLYKIDKDRVFRERVYNSDMLWSANESSDMLTDHISTGDVIGIRLNNEKACVLNKMVDINELAKYIMTGNGDQFIGNAMGISSSRDSLLIDRVSNIKNHGNNASFSIGSQNVYETSLFDIVTISANDDGGFSCDIKDYLYPSRDLMEFNGQSGDYVYERILHSTSHERVIYRFNADAPDSGIYDNYPYKINNLTLSDTSGNIYRSIPDEGSFIAKIGLTRERDYNGTVYAIISAYADDGSLATMNYASFAAEQTNDISFGLNIQPAGKRISKIKAFVWNSLSGTEPLAQVYEIGN